MDINLKSLLKWNAYHVKREDDADGYSSIDERPPPPPRVQSVRQRPPAPLPLPQRPHSSSSPVPLTECNPPSKAFSSPLRRQSCDLPQPPETKTKPSTLPRPPINRPTPQRPVTMGRFPKGLSQGFNDVVNQLASANLSSKDNEGYTFSYQRF